MGIYLILRNFVVNSVYAPIFMHVNIWIDIIVLVSNGCSSLKPKMWVWFFSISKGHGKIPTHSRGWHPKAGGRAYASRDCQLGTFPVCQSSIKGL